MSSEQSLDPQLIEQTKQQIRMLVNEISQLAKSDMAPEEFYGEFLPRVVSALAAVGGAVWVSEGQGRLALGYQINLQETGLREDEEAQIRHGRLLQKVLTSGEGSLVQPRSGAAGDEQGGNSTDFLLVLAPLKAAEETVGVVEVFQRPDTRPATQKGYLRFLSEMCDRAGEFFKSHQLRHFTDRQLMWTQLEDFTRGVHASLHPRETAYTIANEGRRLIECDRVSVAIRKGRKCVIEAVSGQDLFDKRSNTVRLLGNLATAVVTSGEPIWYTGDTSNMAPQVEDAVQEYVDESHSKTVGVLPLRRAVPEPDDEKEEQEQREYPEPPIGALIVEQIEDSRVPEKMLQRVDVVAEHSATALANAQEHENLFLMPVWRALGRARWVLKARTLPKTVAITGAVLGVILAMWIVPWGFKMQANGTLEPVERYEVFAGINGEVTEVLVEHGQRVEKGQLLARLRNTQLDLEIDRNLGDLLTTEQHIRSTQEMLANSRQLDTARKIQLMGDLTESDLKRDHLLAQQKLLQKQAEDLEVRSPAAGQVLTWDVENRLMSYPAQRGQVLIELANPDGPWELEILMPDKRMGHVVRAEQAKRAKSGGEALTVEFILATESNTTHVGTVKKISQRAEPHGDEGNTVPIKVEITEEVKAQLPQPLRRGAGATAKIDCGYQPIGYVLFHELIAFVQSKILFRWF